VSWLEEELEHELDELAIARARHRADVYLARAERALFWARYVAAVAAIALIVNVLLLIWQVAT
jgi:CHASE3 domain sensor protein